MLNRDEVNPNEYDMNFSWEMQKYESPEENRTAFVYYSAIAPDGGYIGDKDTLDMLESHGIQPQLIDFEHKVCSIGWSEKEQKWYGWSHRALFGFSIGSKVKRGDCGYVPKDKEDYREYMIDFWNSEYKSETWATLSEDEKGVQVSWTYTDDVPNKSIRGTIGGVFVEFPEAWGKGEWEAETWEDAKQMAIDFADSVS